MRIAVRDGFACLNFGLFRHLKRIVELDAKGHWIRYDSFIAPAVPRGLVSDVHLCCLQDDTEPGLDQDMLDAAGGRQILHQDASGLRVRNSMRR